MKLGKKKRAKEESARIADYSLLVEPVITEKSSNIGGAGNRVVFKVPLQASKGDIRSAIERVFQVNVVSINTCNYLGKMKRSLRLGGSMGRRKNFKKAYVTLKEGQSISVVEGL